MGRYVIVAYRPFEGKEEALLAVLKEHLPVLRAEGLATERPPLLMRAADGTMVEVFEWKSERAVEEAHENQAVLDLWARFEKVCEYLPLGELEECKGPFSHFDPVEV